MKIERKQFDFDGEYKDAVTQLIKDYKRRKASYQEIANKLNKDKVETFSGVGEWHPQTVHRILNPLKRKTNTKTKKKGDE